MVIDPVIGWFEIVRYGDKKAITIANLVETKWLSRYPRPIEKCTNKDQNFLVTSSENP